MKKKLMILLVATLFLTMMFSTGCKKKFDITGSWILTFNWVGFSPVKTNSTLSSIRGSANIGSTTIIFSGDKESGTFAIPDEGNSGTYTVDGNNVMWIYNTYGTTYTGTASDDNNMSGTMTDNYGSGTWTATRQ